MGNSVGSVGIEDVRLPEEDNDDKKKVMFKSILSEEVDNDSN